MAVKYVFEQGDHGHFGEENRHEKEQVLVETLFHQGILVGRHFRVATQFRVVASVGDVDDRIPQRDPSHCVIKSARRLPQLLP